MSISVNYKNNKYLKKDKTWYIVGEDPKEVVTIGGLAKLKYPKIIKELERILHGK